MAKNPAESAPKEAPGKEDVKKIPTDKERLAAVKNAVDTKTREAAIKGWDPTAKMKLNLEWAKQYPDHPLAKSINELKSYWDLTTDKKAAENAVKKMIEIQQKLGIKDAKGQDGIIWSGTINKFEKNDKDKEQKDAQKIIEDFNQSLYVPDLQNRTKQAEKEKKGILDVWTAFWEKGGKAAIDVSSDVIGGVFKGTVVKDAKGVEYKVGKWAEWQTQYTAKSGEVFEISKDNKLVSVKKQAVENKEKWGEEIKTVASYKSDKPWGELQSSGNGKWERENDTTSNMMVKIDWKWTIVKDLQYDNTQDIVTKTKAWDKWTTADGRDFWKREWIDENPIAVRWKDQTKTNPTDQKEYYNIKEKKWEDYTSDIHQKMAREGLKKIVKDAKTQWTETSKDVLSWTGRNDKKFTDMPISDVTTKELYWGNSHENIAKPILERMATKYKALSTEDQQALRDKKVTIWEFRDMVENPAKAASKFAPTDKPGKLPAGLGEPDSLYQGFEKNVFVTRKGETLPKILYNDGTSKDIKEVFSKSGEYALPDGKELRVSIKDGKKTFSVAERHSATEPKWVINDKWELEGIKKA